MEYLILKYAHILAFVYWLGGDLGTFFSSKYLARPELSPQTRGVALKIMLACDQGPKLAMPIIFPVGLEMASRIGLVSLPAWVLVLMWLVCALWVVNVLYLYKTKNLSAKAKVAAIDWWVRVLVVIAIVGFSVVGLLDNSLIAAQWVAYKMLIFAAMVCCGLMVRKNLAPFIVAFGQLMREGPSDEINTTIASALHSVHPWVYAIWLGLFINAAFGIHLIG